MLSTLRSMFKQPQPAGPPELVRTFGPTDIPITVDGVKRDDGGWRINVASKSTLRMFEVAGAGMENCILTYRVRMRTEDLRADAYLEMWCRIPGMGEFFSKGVNNKVRGTTSWASYETPFFLRKGQRVDLVKLNVVAEGSGTIWLTEVELWKTPVT